MEAQHATLEESLTTKFDKISADLLDCSNGNPKPIWTATIAGTSVSPEAMEAFREIGYEYICEIKQSTCTQQAGKCTTIIFYA